MTISPAALALLCSRVTWEERWLELEAVGAVSLPGYAGSTLRGALGMVMRPALCALAGQCGEQCGSPETCPFFSLFEQSRAGGGQGPNIPKPLILESPLGEGLRTLALGGAAAPMGMELPEMEARDRVALKPGTPVVVGLRALGAAGAALDGIVEGVRRSGGLEVKGGRLRLVGVEARKSGLREAMGDAAAEVGRVRLGLVTPTLIGGAGGRTCFDPVALGAGGGQPGVDSHGVLIQRILPAAAGRQDPVCDSGMARRGDDCVPAFPVSAAAAQLQTR